MSRGNGAASATARWRQARADAWGLAFACVFPTLLTAIYFVGLADAATGLQQAIYGVGKLAQFAFPFLFLRLLTGRRPRLPLGGEGRAEGLLSGLVILASLVALYLFLGRAASDLLAELSPRIAAKVTGMGVGTPGRYLALGIFYSLAHSFLEEYYWRWFVFGRLRRHTGATPAIFLSSLAFASHHGVLMGFYLGWDSPLAYLFSLAVAVSGAYWAWLYRRSGSLIGPWLSHLFADAAIFSIGYDLI